ncbi:MAG: hypothetical protein AAFO29_15060, partial [Actinomycetota bacterium]
MDDPLTDDDQPPAATEAGRATANGEQPTIIDPVDPLHDGDEFADVDDPDSGWQGVDWTTLRQPQVVQAIIAMSVSIGVLFWPDLADRTVAALLAVAVGAVSLIWLIGSIRGRQRAG